MPLPAPRQARPDGEIALNRAARRDLERAAGGFFLIDAEVCDHDQSAPAARAPRIASLTVLCARRGRHTTQRVGGRMSGPRMPGERRCRDECVSTRASTPLCTADGPHLRPTADGCCTPPQPRRYLTFPRDRPRRAMPRFQRWWWGLSALRRWALTPQHQS